MASSGQTTRAAAAAARPQTGDAAPRAPFGFSTTDIPVGPHSTETDTVESYNRGIPLCAVSVLALLIVLALIVFS